MGYIFKEEEIRDSLIEQLREKGADKPFFIDLVNDYIRFWNIKNKLFEDVETRGVTTEYNNGGGQTGVKKNDSVPELNRTNGQMLKILSELGLKTNEINLGDDDNDL